MSKSRIIAAMAFGLTLANCSMSMPSFDFFKSGPATDVLRIESEPPGADARTSQGQTCRTPCELTVPTDTSQGRFVVQVLQDRTAEARTLGSLLGVLLARWILDLLPTIGGADIPRLATVHIDRAAGTGDYWEPNLWLIHQVKPDQ